MAPAGLTAGLPGGPGLGRASQKARHGLFTRTCCRTCRWPSITRSLKEIVVIPKNFRFAYKLEGWTDAKSLPAGRTPRAAAGAGRAASPFAIPALLQVPAWPRSRCPLTARGRGGSRGPTPLGGGRKDPLPVPVRGGWEAGTLLPGLGGRSSAGSAGHAPGGRLANPALRLDARIRNTSRLTFQEAAAQPPGGGPGEVARPRELDEVVKAGRTRRLGHAAPLPAPARGRRDPGPGRVRGETGPGSDRPDLPGREPVDGHPVGIREAGKTDLMVAAVVSGFAQPGAGSRRACRACPPCLVVGTRRRNGPRS